MKTKQNQKSKFMEKGIRSVFTEDGVGWGEWERDGQKVRTSGYKDRNPREITQNIKTIVTLLYDIRESCSE